MTVQDLIETLKEFPLQMRVVDINHENIQEVYKTVLTHNNYPYNKPSEEVVVVY